MWCLRGSLFTNNSVYHSVRYLTVVSLVAEGGGNAVLDGLDPGLSQLLRVCLHHAAPVGTHERHITAVCSICSRWVRCFSTYLSIQKHFPLSWLMTKTHLVGETTSKQKRRSMSSQCLTVHSLRSSTTTVGLSWGDRTGALVTIMLETIFETHLFLLWNICTYLFFILHWST